MIEFVIIFQEFIHNSSALALVTGQTASEGHLTKGTSLHRACQCVALLELPTEATCLILTP